MEKQRMRNKIISYLEIRNNLTILNYQFFGSVHKPFQFFSYRPECPYEGFQHSLSGPNSLEHESARQLEPLQFLTFQLILTFYYKTSYIDCGTNLSKPEGTVTLET